VLISRSLRIAMLLALAGLISACGTGEPEPGFHTVQIDEGKPIVIGVSTMLEGELSSVGQALRDAAVLAGEGISVAGHEIDFVDAADDCTEQGGAEAARELIQADGLVAVVGPSCSDAVLGAEPVFEGAGITHVSQLSTNIATTEPDDRAPFPTFLRTAFNDAIQGAEQADFAERDLGARSVFIVYEAFRYGGASETFRESFGGTFSDDVGFDDVSEFPDIASAIVSADPDLVYFSGFYPTGIPFVRTVRDAGYAGPILAGDAMYDQAMIDGLGELAEQELYVTLPSPPQGGPEFEDFRARYEEAYGADPSTTSFTAESFDAATAIIEGLRADGVVEQGDGGMTVDLAALNAAIHDVVFDGASGPIRFDANGDRVAEGVTPVTVFVVRDGSFVPVQREE
jgi:branched-chain amino acid transport system substrate-binding protein